MFLFKWIRSFSTSARSTQFSSMVFVSSISSCLCFSALPPFFFEDSDFLIKHPFILVKSLHYFLKMLLPGGSHEDALLVRHSSFFSSPVDSIQAFGVDHIFSSFQKFYHTGAPHNHPLFAIHLFRSAQDISKIRVSTLHSFKIFRGRFLIQPI